MVDKFFVVEHLSIVIRVIVEVSESTFFLHLILIHYTF